MDDCDDHQYDIIMMELEQGEEGRVERGLGGTNVQGLPIRCIMPRCGPNLLFFHCLIR